LGSENQRLYNSRKIGFRTNFCKLAKNLRMSCDGHMTKPCKIWGENDNIKGGFVSSLGLCLLHRTSTLWCNLSACSWFLGTKIEEGLSYVTLSVWDKFWENVRRSRDRRFQGAIIVDYSSPKMRLPDRRFWKEPKSSWSVPITI
jgi:hypothetical protein